MGIKVDFPESTNDEFMCKIESDRIYVQSPDFVKNHKKNILITLNVVKLSVTVDCAELNKSSYFL